jgi:hypothetical protein
MLYLWNHTVYALFSYVPEKFMYWKLNSQMPMVFEDEAIEG